MKLPYLIVALFFFNIYSSQAQNTIALTKRMAPISTAGEIKVYYDYLHKENFNSIIPLLPKFEKLNLDTAPQKFDKSQHTNWMHFKVYNPYQDTFFLLLQWSYYLDSIAIYHNEEIILKEIALGSNQKPDKYGIVSMPQVNFYVLPIPNEGEYSIIIKNYDPQYGISGKIPRLFDAYTFEGKLLKDNYFINFLFEGSILVLLSLIILFGFHAIKTNDKLIYWYVAYAFACLIINFRNLEVLNPHFLSTRNYFSWRDSKLFHSALVYFTYIKFLEIFLNSKNKRLQLFTRLIYVYIILLVGVELILSLHGDNFSYYRYINYRMLRVPITIFGIFLLKLTYQSETKYAKYIFFGIVIMIATEIIGWGLPGIQSNIISLLGIYAEFIIFSLVLSLRSFDYIRANQMLSVRNQSLQLEKVNISRDIESKISRDLHDDVGSGLVSLKYFLNNFDLNMPNKQDLEKVKDLIDEIQDNIRQSIFSLNPENRILEEFVLEIKSFFTKYCQYHRLQLTFQVDIPQNTLLKEIKASSMRNIYLSLRELCNNTFKHSDATNIFISFNQKEGQILINFSDDGQPKAEPNTGQGNGLKNIKKRIESENGTVSFQNSEAWLTIIKIPYN